MYFKSPYPPIPALPDRLNVHSFIFDDPVHTVSQNYTYQIDALSGRAVSRDEFIARARDGATALRASVSDGGLGIGSADDGELVAIYSHNCLDFAALVHSLLINAIPVAFIPAYGTRFETAEYLRIAQATRLFVQPSLIEDALEAAKEVGLPDEYIYTMGERHDTAGRRSYAGVIDEVRHRGLKTVPVRLVDQDAPACIVYSSGTTGLFKAVIMSHGNICCAMLQVDVAGKAEGYTITNPPPLALAYLPMYHSFGLNWVCFAGFWIRCTYLVVPKWDAEQVLEFMSRYTVNVLLMHPSSVHQMVHHTDFRPEHHLVSVELMISSAAHLSPSLTLRLQRANPKMFVTEGYGMSEVAFSIARTPSRNMLPGLVPRANGTLGVLVPGLEGRTVREDGSEAAVGEPGELWVRGGNVIKRYWRNDEATKATFVDGWLRTGDCLKVDEFGRLFFVERMKGTLKVLSLQVSPTEIENLILAHPDKLVMDVCVAGVLGGRTTDERIPRAWITLSQDGKRRGDKATIEALDQWVKQRFSRHKWLTGGIEVVDTIPKSPTGKALRRTLVAQHEQLMNIAQDSAQTSIADSLLLRRVAKEMEMVIT